MGGGGGGERGEGGEGIVFDITLFSCLMFQNVLLSLRSISFFYIYLFVFVRNKITKGERNKVARGRNL